MKWYQYFIFLLILSASLQAINTPIVAFENTLAFDAKSDAQEIQDSHKTDPKGHSQKSDSKDNQELKKSKNSAKQKEQTDSDNQTIVSDKDLDHQDPSNIKKATESYETAFIKTIVVLVGLLVLVVLTVWMFKKLSHGRLRSFNYMKSIKILEKRPLSPKSMLYLIEVGGKQILISESQLHVTHITSLDWLGSEKDL